ncbi:XisI protein [Roseofilum sp. Guam]|uniref:XisI protein n=1 Tax=Roseofilum sp. Guam TaxID=2821502 RepID=UPI001B1252F8|nr:XisI protein [Roseofilum sp. Guam]MBP0029797.1 XisI protein [Roseofilum sp. Guam]
MAQLENKLEDYRKIIAQILQNHGQYKPSHGEIKTFMIQDEMANNCLLLDAGWDRTGRVHVVVFHLRIVDDKIWIEVDGTEKGIALELMELGIPQEDIVWGFIRPQNRPVTKFSVA